MIKTSSKTVLIGLSGGVDSATAAKLLKEAGFNVIGVHLKLWNEKLSVLKEREGLVKKVAQKIEVPLIIYNAQKEFKKYVIDYFLKELKNGRTPNPCIDCNYFVKFKALSQLASKLKAQYIATGHYARIKKTKQNGKIIYELLRGKDKNKDQSYFLWRLNQNILRKTIFPLAEFKKEEVKKMADFWQIKFTKPVKESQNLCFTNDLEKFIFKNLKTQKGAIFDLTQNKKVGEHLGIYFYTIGQRKNIRIPYKEPYYVVKKDKKTNQLFIAPASKKEFFQTDEIKLERVNFVSFKPKLPLKCEVKIRYRSEFLKAILYQKNKKYYLKFLKPALFVTPGQSAVFYQKEKLIGGGVIK